MFRLARRCATAAELGVRYGTSATAIVAGLAAGRGTGGASFTDCVNSLADLAALAAPRVAVRFVQADSLEVFLPEEVDLLHVDTLHTAEQLLHELLRHAPRVKRFIALHDTEKFGEVGEDLQPGLLSAIRDFLRHDRRWRVIKRCRRQNGMTVLVRRASLAPSP